LTITQLTVYVIKLILNLNYLTALLREGVTPVAYKI